MALIIKKQTSGSVLIPAADQSAIFVDSDDGQLKSKNSSDTVISPGAGVNVQQTGTLDVASATTLNFAGDGVQVNSSGQTATVTVGGGVVATGLFKQTVFIDHTMVTSSTWEQNFTASLPIGSASLPQMIVGNIVVDSAGVAGVITVDFGDIEGGIGGAGSFGGMTSPLNNGSIGPHSETFIPAILFSGFDYGGITFFVRLSGSAPLSTMSAGILTCSLVALRAVDVPEDT